MLTSSAFPSRVLQAIRKAAIAISGEQVNPEEHVSVARKQLATSILLSAEQIEKRFSPLVATQMTSENPEDSEIYNSVSGLWTMVALAMYPAA